MKITFIFIFRFESNLRYTDQLQVRLISDQVLSHVEFRSSPDPAAKNLLSKLNFRLSTLKVDHKVSPINRDLRKSLFCFNTYSTGLFAAVDRRLEQPRSHDPLLLPAPWERGAPRRTRVRRNSHALLAVAFCFHYCYKFWILYLISRPLVNFCISSLSSTVT